jgi:hypothetical protein
MLSFGKMIYSLSAQAVEPETRMPEFRILAWPGVKRHLPASETRTFMNGCNCINQVAKRADIQLSINPDFASRHVKT